MLCWVKLDSKGAAVQQSVRPESLGRVREERQGCKARCYGVPWRPSRRRSAQEAEASDEEYYAASLCLSYNKKRGRSR